MKKLKENKVGLLLSVAVALLLLNIMLLPASFAKYRETATIDVTSGIIAFDPEIENHFDLDGGMARDENGDIPAVFAKPQELDVNVFVTLESEGELPIVYSLILEDGTVLEGEREGNVFTFVFTVPAGETPEFKISPKWDAPYYDERLNSLSEDVSIRIVCEQNVEA